MLPALDEELNKDNDFVPTGTPAQNRTNCAVHGKSVTKRRQSLLEVKEIDKSTATDDVDNSMLSLLEHADDNSSCASKNSSMPGLQGRANEDEDDNDDDDDDDDEDGTFDLKVADGNIEVITKN